jgi:hypothetical protein
VIRVPITNPKAVGLAAVAGLAAWKASNFSVDPTHITEAIIAATGGAAIPHNPTSNPSVQPESHIITPYVNNVE